MIQITLDKKVLLGMECETLEERIDFFSNHDVIKNLDMLTIKTIYQKTIDRAEKSSDYIDVITLLQTLAYNRHKSQDKDELVDFIFDKIFELIVEGDAIC